jgi:hypothetical protein
MSPEAWAKWSRTDVQPVPATVPAASSVLDELGAKRVSK